MKATISPRESTPFLNWKYEVTLTDADGKLIALAFANDVLTASIIANSFNAPVTVEV